MFGIFTHTSHYHGLAETSCRSRLWAAVRWPFEYARRRPKCIVNYIIFCLSAFAFWRINVLVMSARLRRNPGITYFFIRVVVYLIYVKCACVYDLVAEKITKR